MSAVAISKLEALLQRVQERRTEARVPATASTGSGAGPVALAPVPSPSVHVVESEPPIELDVPDNVRTSAPPYDPVALTDPAPSPWTSPSRSPRPDRPSMSAPTNAATPEASASLSVEDAPLGFGDAMARTLLLRPKRS